MKWEADVGEQTEALTKMIGALGLEIAEIKKRGGSNTVELHGGEARGAAAGSFLYSFVLHEEVHLREDAPVRATVGAEDVGGMVVSLGEGTVVVGLEKDFGPRIPFARLVTDDSFLLEALRKKLIEVAGGRTSFNLAKAEEAISQRAPPGKPVPPAASVLPAAGAVPAMAPAVSTAAVAAASAADEGELNLRQTEALKTVGSNDVTYIWGPPGTGKTRVVAHVVERLFRDGFSVLLVSNTNMAVDTALEKTMERLRDAPGVDDGAVLRLGPMVKDELVRRHGDNVDIERVVARRSATLLSEKARLTDEKHSREAAVTAHRRTLQDYEQAESAGRKVAELRVEFERLERDGVAHQLAAARCEAARKKLRADLDRYSELNAIRRLFSGINPDRVREQLDRAERDRDTHTLAAAKVAETAMAARASLSAAQAQEASARRRLAGKPPKEQCSAEIRRAEARVAELERSISAVDARLQAVAGEVMKGCRVLATTVYRAYLPGLVERQFEAVVVDEASMVGLPMIFYVAGLATERIVIAGDFLQLPAIVMSDSPEVAEWVKQDVFRKTGIEAALRGGVVRDGVVALNEQYRMADPICSVVNDIFYSEYRNPLVTRTKDNPRPLFPLGTKRLLYVDTGPLKPWASVRLGTYSRYNLLHAILARGLVAHLKREGYLPPPGEANNQLGVVTPYTAQTNLAKLLLEEVLGPAGSGYASTVHRFQGNEKTAMLIDIPDCTGVQPSRFIKAKGVHEDGARLLNVALSRARERLILLADFEYLRRRVGEDSVVGRVLRRFENDGAALDVADVVKLGPDNWINGIRKVDPPQFELDPKATGVFTEATFFPAFRQDVLRAKSSVVIFSPYVTERGAGRLADLLRAKLAEGVKVRLVTRPPDDQAVMSETASLAIGALRALGVAVDLRQSMHEKLAAVDGEIAWAGSLNIMSHRDTSELMFRLANREVHDRLAQFVSVPRRSRDENADGASYPLADRENPACARCKSPTVWKNGRYGIYFECPECGNKQSKTGRGFGAHDGVRGAGHGAGRTGQRRSGRRSSPTKAIVAGVVPRCPVHHVPMVLRNGRYGEFYGCPKYPACRETAPV